MTESSSLRAGAGPAAWQWWAASIVPAMIIIPFYLFPITPGGWLITAYDGRRLLELVWAAGLVLVLLRPATRMAAVRTWLRFPRSTRIAITVFLLGALVSSLLSSAPAYALRGWALMTLLLVGVLSLAAILGPIRSKVLEWTGLTLLLYGILVFTEPGAHGFANPRFQGQVLAVTVPALLYAGILPLALMAAPALAAGIINGSRAMILTIAFMTVATPFMWSDRRRRVGAGLAGLALTACLMGILLWLGQDTPAGAAVIERGSSGRLTLWGEALQRFASAPILGIGPEMMARAPGSGPGNAHPHNSVLLVAVETGLVGLLSIGFLAWQGLTRLPRLDPDRRPWGLAVGAGAFHSLFSGTIIMPASQAILVLALALALPDADGEAGAPARPATGWTLVLVGAAALAIVLATLWLPSAGSGALEGGPYPRFFVDGLTP